jgi:alanine dehydrogenase
VSVAAAVLRHIGDDAVAAALPYAELVEAMPGAFGGDILVPQRTVIALPGGGSMLVMSAARPGGLAIVKCVTIAGGHERLEAYLTVQDGHGLPMALVAGHELTARRTAAASVLAAKHLCRLQPRTLAILGSGRQARAHLEAYLACFPIETVRIWARRPDAGEALASHARSLRVEATAAGSPREAASASDIVCCATPSTSPLLSAADIKPGAHVDLVGGFRSGMREADDALIARADIAIDSPAAADEAGDLVQPLAAGIIRAEALTPLRDVLVGRKQPRRGDITLFKSVGFAGEDLIAAELLMGRRGLAPATLEDKEQ